MKARRVLAHLRQAGLVRSRPGPNDRRAAAAVEAERAETTVAGLVGSTDAATLTVAGGGHSRR